MLLINPLVNKIYYHLPLFITNGKDRSILNYYENSAEVSVGNFKYKVNTEGTITIEKKGMETGMVNISWQVFSQIRMN